MTKKRSSICRFTPVHEFGRAIPWLCNGDQGRDHYGLCLRYFESKSCFACVILILYYYFTVSGIQHYFTCCNKNVMLAQDSLWNKMRRPATSRSENPMSLNLIVRQMWSTELLWFCAQYSAYELIFTNRSTFLTNTHANTRKFMHSVNNYALTIVLWGSWW